MDYTPQYGRYEVAHPVGGAKDLNADRFGKKNGPSWRTWSYLARDFVGVVHVALKQAMKTAKNQKQPIAVTHFHQELQHFLISRTEGEALEIVRGAAREPGLKQWRRLAALSCLRRTLPKLTTSRTTIHAWEIVEQRHRERTGDQLPKDMRLAILLSVCSTDLEKELTA